MNMDIYDNGIWVGELGACSIYDLNGSSYVHIHLDKRKRYGMEQEPYDLFFSTCHEAIEAAASIIGEGFSLAMQ